jgi:hypothetical protein
MLRIPNFLYKSFHECKDYSIFFTYDTLLHALAATESCMHRAGFTGTRSHPPLQIPAKADNQKRCKPARMVYTACWSALFYFSVRSLIS